MCKQLKDQYTRTKAMMEQFMEDGVEFIAQEIANLQKNPVIEPIPCVMLETRYSQIKLLPV